MQFTRIGVPVYDAGLFNYTVGPGASGRVDSIYLSFFQNQAPGFIVGVNLATGECNHYQSAREDGCWAITVGPDNCIYTGSCTREGRLTRINPGTGEVVDLGRAIDTETYVWSLVTAADGCIYGGTFPNAKLFRLDPVSGSVTDLGTVVPGEKYNRHLVVSGPYVYCAVGTVKPTVVAYDVNSGVLHRIELPGLDISGVPSFVVTETGDVYCTLSADRYGNRQVFNYQLVELAARPVTEIPPARLMQLADGRHIKAVNDRSVTLVTEDGLEQEVSYQYQGAGAMLFVLRNGPDGNLYGSTALPLRLFSVNPNTYEMANLGNPTATSGEIYSILSHENTLFTCAYPRAALTTYTPNQHDPATQLGFIGEGQDRAPDMILGPDNYIYIGTVPTYGELGGALVRLDPVHKQWVVHRHVVPDQSVVSLAADKQRNRVYAGTSVGGGGGSRPKATCASLFAWDCNTQSKVGEWQPFGAMREIPALAVVNRRLFGLTSDGRMFVFCLDNEEVVHQVEPGLGHSYMGALVPYETGLLGLLGNHIVRIDADTYAIQVLGEYPGISAGFAVSGNQVFFASKAEIIAGTI